MTCAKTFRKHTACVPARAVIAGLVFSASALTFSYQVNLNQALLAMVNQTLDVQETAVPLQCYGHITRDVNGTVSKGGSTKQDGEFNWSSTTQGLILGAFFYGAISTHTVGGILVQRFSASKLVLISILVSSILSLLIPISTRLGGVVAIFVIRTLQGLLIGIFLPVSYAMTARWSPVNERSFLVSLSHVGSVLGGALTVVVAGYITAYSLMSGWPAIFYLTGAFGCVFSAGWYFLAYDSPEEHPNISSEELLYITKSSDSGSSTTEKRTDVPWMSVVKSVPFWSLTFVRFTANWGFTTLTTATPIYLQVALNMPMHENGLVNGALLLASVVSSLVAGTMADLLRKKTSMSITAIRKTMSGIAYTCGAICWFSITFAGCNAGAASVIIICTKLMVSLSIGGDYGTIVDMAPKFAGPLSGILYTVSDLGGVLSPLLTGIITDGDVTLERWQIVFCTAAGIQLLGLAQFLVLGSAELQPWAKSPEDDIEKGKKFRRDVTESGPLINDVKASYKTILT